MTSSIRRNYIKLHYHYNIPICYSTGISLDVTGPNAASFLDYNDPINIPHLAGTFTTNISSLSDAVTPPPPPHSTTTTIIVVSTTPSDVDVQVS